MACICQMANTIRWCPCEEKSDKLVYSLMMVVLCCGVLCIDICFLAEVPLHAHLAIFFDCSSAASMHVSM